MTALDDKTLVERTLAGERDAYRLLVQRYQARIFAIAHELLKNKADAEDIAQEAFVKAFLSLKEFRGESSFYTWVYRIVYNMVLDYKRRVARRGGPAAELTDIGNGEVPTMGRVDEPQQALFRKEQRSHIRRAIDSLSDEHRTVIMLREVDGLSYEEIAEATGASKGTVMSRLFYARKKLQEVLADFAPPGAAAGGERASGGEEGPPDAGERHKTRHKASGMKMADAISVLSRFDFCLLPLNVSWRST